MTLHTKLSYLKSLMRIFGFGLLLTPFKASAVILLIGAEINGILEEVPKAYIGTKTQ